jgi:hypothetical protein
MSLPALLRAPSRYIPSGPSSLSFFATKGYHHPNAIHDHSIQHRRHSLHSSSSSTSSSEISPYPQRWCPSEHLLCTDQSDSHESRYDRQQFDHDSNYGMRTSPTGEEKEIRRGKTLNSKAPIRPPRKSIPAHHRRQWAKEPAVVPPRPMDPGTTLPTIIVRPRAAAKDTRPAAVRNRRF